MIHGSFNFRYSSSWDATWYQEWRKTYQHWGSWTLHLCASVFSRYAPSLLYLSSSRSTRRWAELLLWYCPGGAYFIEFGPFGSVWYDAVYFCLVLCKPELILEILGAKLCEKTGQTQLCQKMVQQVSWPNFRSLVTVRVCLSRNWNSFSTTKMGTECFKQCSFTGRFEART